VTGEPRRRDAAATRQALRDAATELFAERGYDRTTVRDIATRAGVNQALLFRYFGSKEALFEEATAGHTLRDVEPRDLVAEMLDNLLDPSSAARRDQVLTALLRTLGTDDEAAAIRGKLNAAYAEALATLTDGPDAELRADLVLAWLFGISLMRGVAATQPLAGADPARVRELVLPAVRTLLEKVAASSAHGSPRPDTPSRA
jgi:AcrR family transcriptional regulator